MKRTKTKSRKRTGRERTRIAGTGRERTRIAGTERERAQGAGR